jgi:hypothetical protein
MKMYFIWYQKNTMVPRYTVEPAYKDILWTSDLTRIIEVLAKKTGHKDTSV